MDNSAPKPVSFLPENASTDFTSKQIILEFDEYFGIKSPTQTILISPPMNPSPTYTVKGKKLIVDINAELKPNTTYSIYFANTIRDNHEGRDTSFLYVFSTGSYIDSSSISAKVVDAFTGNPVADVWLMAYESEDSLIEHKRPDFIAKTAKDGRATISHIPKGDYKMFALLDENFDLKYSFPDERIAFLNSTVSTDLDSSTVVLRMFMGVDSITKLVGSKYIHPGLVEMYFNRNLDPVDLKLPQELKYISVPNDTIKIYLSDEFSKGSAFFNYNLNSSVDTLRYYIPQDRALSFVKASPQISGNVHYNKPLKLLMPRPITIIDSDKIHLFNDSVEVPLNFEVDSNATGMVKIFADFDPGTKYKLKIDRNAISCLHGIASDSSTVDFNTYKSDYLGKITFRVQKDGSGLIQLLNQGKLIASFSEKSIVFKDLPPGKYSIRYIADKDKNGEWSTGNYFQNTQPEDVYYFPEIMELKSGWDVEQTWIID